ncbi:hypothetical protein Pelo_11336 [Pelomyxa schiedti]|nr:hypothetical protein Pelo_11336 [Pelomyxa schiedti]
MLNLGEVVRKRPPPSHDLCQPLPKVSRAGINKVECLARCLPSLQDTTQLARLTGFIEETPELKFFAENAPITPGKAQELLVNATMKKAETEVTRVKAMLQQYLTTLETNKKVVEDCIAFLEICPLNYQVLHALSRVSQPITAIPVIQTLMSQ